jgi:hypothetical protein
MRCDLPLRDALLALGCRQGTGDLYQVAFPQGAAGLRAALAI